MGRKNQSSTVQNKTLRDYMTVGFRRKWMFMVPCVLAAALVVMGIYALPKKYCAIAVARRTDKAALTAAMRVARAGQPLPMIYRSSEKKAHEFSCSGVYPLGIEPYEIKIPVTETKLEAGDRFLVYTDGVSERFNIEGDIYGEKRVLRLFATDSAENPQNVLAAIMADVDRFTGKRPADYDQALLLGIID